ncbi:hypothetical protein GS624_01130 [Ruegeria sp. HKCCD5849]|uniref:hypothetical protein n=1 Tax=unclassified Ruegeria TaxID=2625375 RepID=UPI00149160A2|nr:MULTISPECIES: hypothetical protein [unclassified Ruegeria]NOD45907.1 hypothetical protein [Ruegeria sp. HKCCD5849]NOD50793.1 hypothetical protein [Ruegeria sp. HKCCD5851]
MSIATVVFVLVTILYLMIGRVTYQSLIVPSRNRDALGGDVNAMVWAIHEQEKSLVHYLTYGGWLLFYPAFFALGWLIARLDIDI